MIGLILMGRLGVKIKESKFSVAKVPNLKMKREFNNNTEAIALRRRKELVTHSDLYGCI